MSIEVWALGNISPGCRGKDPKHTYVNKPLDWILKYPSRTLLLFLVV